VTPTPRTAAGQARERRRPASRGAGPHRERLWVGLLLVLHAALAVWGAARNSVTFDENFHVPSGVLIAAAGEFRVSAVNPPLVKALGGAAALVAGARLPSAEAMGDGEQGRVGEAFMRANADRYHRVFFAARLVVIALSVLLGWIVWRWARRLYGARGGLFALILYALTPEALAHAGVATLDLATALGFTASVYAFWVFARTGRRGWWLIAALAIGATFLTRFAAVLLVPMLVALAALGTVTRRFRDPGRVWLGLGLFTVTTLVLVNLGYLGRTSFEPLSAWTFDSRPFQSLRAALPWLPVPLPDAFVGGFDRQLVESGPGVTPTYLFGTIRDDAPWYYFPVALLFKWPVALLLAILARLATRGRASLRGRVDEAFVLAPALGYLAVAMFVSNLAIGVRYVLPMLPFVCVWCGGLAAAPRSGVATPFRRMAGARLAPALALVLAVETAFTAPWYLSFFNALAGGADRGARIVNDSNVDWGQGLIALRDELRRRGIARIHLAYHGTTDPAVYGIDYLPYLGGRPGEESEWLAVSRYYDAGLSQRMMTRAGRTQPVRFDFSALPLQPVATPGRAILLYRLPATRP
jgi:hypothetical protein